MNNKKILLVDDDDISNFLTSMVLKEFNPNAHINVCLNGKQALDYLIKHCLEDASLANCPEFIFLDINMPVMDGFEFLKALTSTKEFVSKKYKIIILSSSDHLEDLESARKFQISGYINKPLTKEKLETFSPSL